MLYVKSTVPEAFPLPATTTLTSTSCWMCGAVMQVRSVSVDMVTKQTPSPNYNQGGKIINNCTTYRQVTTFDTQLTSALL